MVRFAITPLYSLKQIFHLFKWPSTMNRHQRRAAKHQQDTPESRPSRDIDIQLGDTLTSEPKPQSGFILRSMSKIILSQWVLTRVRHHEVERLLMSLAMEVGRTDVVDLLLRRQIQRSKGPR